ncbi:hypothetical protein [Aquitalea sp. USM4]|uniref:hypothetical protein n=1 Tax=Aquitalea sp. USM4 TaxID=1590041 RepID=UPI00103B6C35|nr:hypothetical protein [Aquitalea sp. USM4]QBJ80509.1 hypothetical protein DKK66_19870 [Aquitalea sp. USM4]
MFEAYSVAVKLSLINNVSAGLLAISKNLQSTHMDAAKLEEKLKSIGKQAALGGIMFGGGMAIAGMFKTPLQEAMKYQKEMAKLQQMGLGSAQIAEAQKFVQATQIMGTSMMDRVKIFTDAQGAFRQSGMTGMKALDAAKIMTPALANYQVAMQLLSEDKQGVAHEQFQQLNKTVELMGGLNSPIRAQQIVDGIFKAVQSSGKMISNRDLRQFISQAGPAAVSLTDKTIFAGLEPIIGEFGGFKVGTGLNTAYNRTHGIMALSPSILTNEAIRLGVWDEKKVERTKGGGARFKHGSPMNLGLAHLQETDTLAFAQAMMDIYRKNGITKLADLARENAILFGTTGGRIYTKIMQQMPVLRESEAAFDVSKNTKQTVANNADSPMMKTQQLAKAMENLKLAIGQNLLPVFTPLVTELTDLAKKLSQHPRLIKDVTFAFVGLSGVLVAGGVANGLIATSRLLMLLGGNVLFLGRALLLNPIGLTLTAIAGAAYLLWKNWDTVGPLLSKAWDGIKSGFHSFVGLFLGGWQGLFNSIIAGMNAILPAARQIGSMHFADDWNRNDASYSNEGRGYVTPPPSSATGGTQVIQLHVDGKKMTEVVTTHQAKAASRPMTGMQGFDAVRNVILPGAPSSILPTG